MATMNLADWLKAHGRHYPKADPDGTIPYERFVQAGLPMVVACAGCEMTMASHPKVQVDRNGFVWCSDCSEFMENGDWESYQVAGDPRYGY